MLNYALARERGLSKKDVKDLELYHACMEALVYKEAYDRAYNPVEPPSPKRLRKLVRRLEYMMQDKWGFPRNKYKHTHWRRFACLHNQKPETRTTWG